MRIKGCACLLYSGSCLQLSCLAFQCHCLGVLSCGGTGFVMILNTCNFKDSKFGLG